MATLCGSTIITHYNHKTYKIDDVDFSLSPLSTFNQNGNEVNFSISISINIFNAMSLFERYIVIFLYDILDIVLRLLPKNVQH